MVCTGGDYLWRWEAVLDKSLGKLIRMNLQDFWLDEAKNFTPWLARTENLELLSSTLGMELEKEGVEVPVGPYRADIVARDVSSDTKAIIENQLGKTDHDHLGKAITYASGLDAQILIWIAKEFSEEHRRALDFLNENAAPDLRCFGVEIQLWRIDDSKPAPAFSIVSSPNEYTSIIKKEKEELSETLSLYLEFWSGFRGFCSAEGTFLSLRKPWPRYWFNVAVGRSKFDIRLTASAQKERLGCELYLRGVNAETAFKLLLKQKEGIEKATGPLEWQELPEGQDCRIIDYRADVDITEQSEWEEAYRWLKDKAELFHKTFSPRVKALPVLGSSTEDGASENDVQGDVDMIHHGEVDGVN
jgi:hypothetical protein